MGERERTGYIVLYAGRRIYNYKRGVMYKKDKRYVSDIVEQEGFDYAFTDYTDFHEVKDEKFHELRNAYIKAKEDLQNYIE